MPRNCVQRARQRTRHLKSMEADAKVMRIGLPVTIIALVALIVAAACTQDSRRHEARENALTDQLGDLAKETVYFRDHAGVCWGLVWAGGHHGGPAGGPVPGTEPYGPCPPPLKPTAVEAP